MKLYPSLIKTILMIIVMMIPFPMKILIILLKNITVNKYYGNPTESVCQIKNFILSRDNILEWYDPFKKRYLMAKSP